MKILQGFISIAVITFLFFNLSPTKSYACSCVPPDSVQEELAKSSDVFSGKVIEMKDKNKLKLTQSSADLIEVKIEVNEIWKGNNQPELLVYTERDSASCGFEFALNQEYLVYANEDGGQLRVSLCSRTAPLTAATADLNDLGKGEKPVPQDEKAPKDSDNNNLYFIMIGGGAGLAVGMVIAFFMSRKSKI